MKKGKILGGELTGDGPEVEFSCRIPRCPKGVSPPYLLLLIHYRAYPKSATLTLISERET